MRKALEYLSGIEAFQMLRQGITETPYDFDVSHYREFLLWLEGCIEGNNEN